ncbi:flagellar protein FlgN [Bacillus sp. FJAT-29790]|uniref:flagellar protein FlgN n=1 Tax=Bacillus sp. FJAT-29790 TaxID=1895002 RepID=UPI001C240DF1|nr:flagellar protein FlgN [Bacillus sp. FJAT-29790]MBU8881180.1 flagellar protein FlgN [Bacillus sp. FJAT-29790]
MPLEKMMHTLEKTLVLHKSLNEIAKKKTDIIVKGDIESLQTILKDENKHIQVIKKLSLEVLKEGESFLLQNGILDPPTLSAIIAYAEDIEKDRLIQLKRELDDQIAILQWQNHSNQELLQQSLQFVNLSLDLLIPDLDSLNYSRSDHNAQDTQQKSRSIFESKA